MRRVVVLALMALALPIAASADIITSNSGRNRCVFGYGRNGRVGHDWLNNHQFARIATDSMEQYVRSLGLVNYTTGALESGSVSGGGTFAGGGSFDIIGTGKWASKLTGIIMRFRLRSLHWQLRRSGYLDFR